MRILKPSYKLLQILVQKLQAIFSIPITGSTTVVIYNKSKTFTAS